ncbi:DUF2268 domain-containing protein [Cytobacillus massiliigabonensis]|uniref:DUF2268 domain-containing protein n=1 Tax=Cytobacillus massiliigabonensis TaxID=1871011 RepID=UPI001F2ED833|nr:DUF2268 domain-containing protein [Cytobacillus massiliigabonensis]
MGVIRTDNWLEKDFNDPVKICQEFMETFGEKKPHNIYNYLMSFGMYRPNRKTYEDYKNLVQLKCWDITERIFKKYRKKWKGPDIPIYIFPAAANSSLFYIGKSEKSGVAFKDKLFLFIPPLTDEKEIEALFVHEYHHTCRLNRQKKHLKDFTLLDSIVLEGLAEYAVAHCCGENYRGKWCDYYTREEIDSYWEKFLSKELHVTKNEKLHDEILYGFKDYPKMIGYAAGFEIVSSYYKEKNLRMEESFFLPSEHFILRFHS